MAEGKFCCLCVSLCSSYKDLFNCDGGKTTFYEITFKYFDPVLLNSEDSKDSNVVCIECWSTISDFYEFQKVIQNAHEDLQESLREIAKQALSEESEKVDVETSNLEKQTAEVSTTDSLETDDAEEEEEDCSPNEDEIPLNMRKMKKSNKNKRNGGRNRQKTAKCKSEDINKDEIISQWKPSLECVMCSIKTTTFALLRTHFRIHHPNEKCYVTCCERKFSKRFDIYEHILVHLDPQTFKCKFCGKCSTNSRNLEKHIRDLHTEEGRQRRYECEVCEKRFQDKTKLRTHMDVHKTECTFLCSKCNKGFSTEQRRNIHEERVHNADRVCDKCGKTIHGLYALRQHLLEHKGVQKPKWPCDLCDAQLYSHTSLKRHKQQRHHNGTTLYTCGECGKSYSTEIALNSHKRLVHTLKPKHICKICSKSFKFPKVLREHLASHAKMNLYQCPHCPKTYRMSSNLHRHRKNAHPEEWSTRRINNCVVNNQNVGLMQQTQIVI
ncbi:zinc finger Y-chromosomal protein-like [Musca autumnalis]|uniref:zinc finger Y-chromosomal protein-like n=1 Tax=Musca autumnalis TaxID=221902 RepID=UPI003CF691E8